MSEYVIMPKADYSAACDAIREKTGKTELIKSGEMESEILGIVSGGGSSEDVRYVTFMSEDGTVELGKKAVATGDDCADPIARGVFSTPTKESTAQYNYTFYGWATTPNGAADSNWNKAVTEDRTVYANFASVVRYYTITYYDSDGATVLKTESLAYGTMPSYKPTKEGATFTMWNPNTAVTGDMSYTAVWEEKITFANASWEKIGEIAKNGNTTEFFAVGDEKEITLSDGSVMTCVIVGFNLDDLQLSTANAPITIAMKNAFNVQTSLGSQITSTTNAAYEKSNIYTTLENTLFPMLPIELRKVIKSVVKDQYDKSTSSKTVCVTKFWAFSAKELGAIGSLGSTYPYFSTDSDNKRKLKTSNGNAVDYWVRDQANFNGYMSYVSTTGGHMTMSLNNSMKYNLHAGFCI